MQQSSSLPEHNSQIDATSKILPTTQQLRDRLWLESSLNQLQSLLNELLLSANTLPQIISTEVEILQTVVNETAKVLNDGWLDLTHFVVGVVQCQPQEMVAKVVYISNSVNTEQSNPEVRSKAKTKQGLKLHATIKLTELQKMERQKPPNAWRLADNSSGMMSWLVMTTAEFNSHDFAHNSSFILLRSQFIHRTVEYCNTTLAQLRQIQFWQQRCQQLANFNQELERTNQLKNQFLANTSHEIRTPLSSIIGFTHLLLAQGYEPDRQRHQEYLHIIQSSGKHLLDLINDILDLSKIEANQLEVQWDVIDVPSLCRNVLALVKEKAANKGLKLRLEINDNVTNLLADPLRLKQMLLNLLFNAVKFTNSGSVGLRVEQEEINGELYLKFTVWDTGIGISQNNQSLLFRPYSQILKPGGGNNEGTGLGLVVTKQLAEIHGGCLKLESEENQGSTFTIFLPLKPTGKVLEAIEAKAEKDLERSQEMIKVSAAESVSHIHKASSQEVLLVENDLANSELMRIYLSRLGYQVTCVNNAQKMWQIISTIDPAVILMDVILPDENGLNLVEKIKKHPQYQNIPIIAQTAMAMKGDRETCLAAGFDDYISKPIELEILGNIVGKYC